MTFAYDTTAEEAAFALKEHIIGKNVLITGVSPKSLGEENVRVLAPYAKTIIIASRSKERTLEVVDSVRKETPSANIIVVVLDLASEASIRAAAAEVLGLELPLHVVINNAAVAQAVSVVRTQQGFESTFGANHLGHFLFNSLIFPAILRATSPGSTDPARIVTVSSAAAHWKAEIRWDDPHYTVRPEEYERYYAYGVSKNANNLFALGLAKRFGSKGVLSLSLHPGAIMSTNMGLTVPIGDLIALGAPINEDGTGQYEGVMKTIQTGTSTQVVAAFDPSLVEHNGSYLSDGVVNNELAPAYSRSEEGAGRLWELSEKIWNITF